MRKNGWSRIHTLITGNAVVALVIPLIFLIRLSIRLLQSQFGISREKSLGTGEWMTNLLPDFYFGFVPGILIISFAYIFYKKFKETAKPNQLGPVDMVAISVAVVSSIMFIWAYIASPASMFYSVEHIIPLGFEVPILKVPFATLTPSLRSFTLWISLFMLIGSFIFVYGMAIRMNWDKQTLGGFIIGWVVAISFALLLVKFPFFGYLEENTVSLLFNNFRNPSTIKHQSGYNYCPPPYDATGEPIEVRPPNPPNVRDDIVIIGISKKTIEQVRGGWPLDWGHYAKLAKGFSGAENSILLFDISFMDQKSVFGGENCGIRFDCTPKGEHILKNQDDILASSLSGVKNTVISDYPMETTDEARKSIVNYENRLEALRQGSRMYNVKNSKYAKIWALLPQPPIIKITKALAGIGYANILKNEWGMNREMPLVIRIPDQEKHGKPGYNPDKDDEFYPNVDLLIAAHYYGIDPVKDISVDFLKGEVVLHRIPKKTRQKVVFGDDGPKIAQLDIMKIPNPQRKIVIPIDDYGRMNINYRGGRYCFKFFELLEVSSWSPDDIAGNFKDKIALVAMYYATGVGAAKDMHLSPYGDMAGIEHHAHALNTILNQDFAKDVAPWFNLMILLVVGLIMGFYQPRVPTGISFLLLALIAIIFMVVTLTVTFSQLSLIHILPTVILEQFVIAIAYIGFKALTEEEKVKFIRNTFSKFVAEDVVSELLSNPEAMKLGGEKKEISVFFSDVRGFTTISEKLGPEELVALLNEYLTVMTELILDYGGTVDKYMGDAIMAFWGAPVPNEDHAYYACVAGLAQVNALMKLQEIWRSKGDFVIDIGIGINTGQAVVGNMGSATRMDYTIMGDTVNLGSRLEGITKTYTVRFVISEYTYEKVKNRVYARELDLVRVKGKIEPVRIYELMGLKNEQDLEDLKRSSVKKA